MRPSHLLIWSNFLKIYLKSEPLLSFGHGNTVRHTTVELNLVVELIWSRNPDDSFISDSY